MCIIAFKPSGVKLPSNKILHRCWDNNPDGAGYMFPSNGKVVIKKGFMTFQSLMDNLKYDYRQYGKETPFVIHFRISTQGGVNKQLCHPFPFSNNMDDLKKQRVKCQLGIAHNGIIDITSESYWNKDKVDYNDTMKFITDYLTLIIKSFNWYEDKDKVKLIERLIDGSRMAIMDCKGHTQLIGNWEQDNGMYYSNSFYKTDRVKYSITKTSTSLKEDTTNDTTRSVGFATTGQSNGNNK